MTTTREPTLPIFEGETVTQAQVRIVNAGDGLSEALKMAPEALHMGEVVYYVLSGEVVQINHRQKDSDEPIIRVHTIKASAITKCDEKTATKLLAEAARALEAARAEASGQLLLEEENAALEREKND